MAPDTRTLRIFAYGTLAAPEVMQALLGRPYPSIAAVLEGYARYAVRGRDYPGIVAEPDARTHGLLYDGLDARAIARLDDFEGSLYERLRLPVRTRTSARVDAEVYAVPAAKRHRLGPEAWDLERFRRSHLDAWVRHCAEKQRPVADDLESTEPAG